MGGSWRTRISMPDAWRRSTAIRGGRPLRRAPGLPVPDWALRLTQVYRRDGKTWRLGHRHADPLAPGVSLEQAAALARGLPG
jgi:hypothetical protein